MLKLENIPPEQMPEVVHIASELYEKDRQLDAETQERQATVDAAKEVGLPEEYLHRAAAELHGRRVAQAQVQRRRRTGWLAAVGATVLIGSAGIFALRSHPDATPSTVATVAQSPVMAPGFSPSKWKLATNTGTQANVTYASDSATIHVQRFAADLPNHFTANFNSFDGAKNLAGARTITFRMSGTLPQVRLYLDHGNERWRSPAIPVQGQEQIVRLDLSQFEHLTRASADASWQKVGYEPPGIVDNLSFKTGWFVNDIGASGDVTLGDIQFE